MGKASPRVAARGSVQRAAPGPELPTRQFRLWVCERTSALAPFTGQSLDDEGLLSLYLADRRPRRPRVEIEGMACAGVGINLKPDIAERHGIMSKGLGVRNISH